MLEALLAGLAFPFPDGGRAVRLLGWNYRGEPLINELRSGGLTHVLRQTAFEQ